MRALLIVAALAFTGTAALAQPTTVPQWKVDELKKPTGTTNLDAHQRNEQGTPQGPSGPLDTTSGGAPAASPQGQTPPGMQAAPEGSDKTITGSDTKPK